MLKVKGKKFKSFKEACRYYDMPSNTVSNRIKKGCDIDTAFTAPSWKPKTITVEGNEFSSIKTASIHYNIEVATVKHRIKNGWSIDDAFLTLPYSREKITVEGNSFFFADACKHYNINRATIKTRLEYGWSIDEAFTHNPNVRLGKPVIVDGKNFPSVDAASRHYGILPITAQKRIQSGWPLEEVFGLKPRIKVKGNAQSVTVENVQYDSLSSAAFAYRLCPILVAHRLRHGWTIEEAFELEPRNASNIKGKVYLISNNKNDKLYVGVTSGLLSRRLAGHIDSSINGTHKLAVAMRELGAENFHIELIEEVSTVAELAEAERYYISQYDSIEQGYNVSNSRYNKPAVKSIKYRGIKYTHHEISAKMGISTGALRYRLQRGLPLDRKQIGMAKPIEFEGKIYASKSELARILNIHRNTFDFHYNRGNLSTYLDRLEGISHV